MDYKAKFHEEMMKQKAYQFVLNIASWDSNTEAPKGCFAHRAEMLGIISGDYFQLLTGKRYQEAVNALYADLENLDDITKREIRKAKKDLDKIVKIPEKDFIEYQKLLTLSQSVWEDAKANNDYKSFKNNLSEIVRYNKMFVNYYGIDAEPYDILLDEYEEGMTMADFDKLFDCLKTELVPFVKEVIAKQKNQNEDFMTAFCPKESQMNFSNYLMDVMTFDRNHGLMKTSVHPFTWNAASSDVRFTTHILENNVFSSVFSTIHELGHASYEQQIDEKWDSTRLSGGTSMGIHESQSRFFENMIGRSKGFWETHLPKLKEIFPEQFKDVSAEELFRAVNKVETSFIRTEADELTYALHIMVRYDIERKMMKDEINYDELPALWNTLMKQYLGIEPKNNTEGVLQDVHWSAGLIGYFPTYALGSAMAAQFYYTMKKDLDLDAIVHEPNLAKIKVWLKEKIHQYGSSKNSKELLLEVTKEEFNPKYYVQYLKEKYSELIK